MPKRAIRLYWWDESPNFGDQLSPFLLERLFQRQSVWADLGTAELTACGSLLQWVTPTQPLRVDILSIWGSGFIFTGEPAPQLGDLRYAAIRGALSARFAGLEPDSLALGDPGLLASLAVRKTAPRYRLGLVPHLWHRQDKEFARLAREVPNTVVVDVASPPEKVLKEISSCEVVISSSLHGLVVADSYGIPSVWVSSIPDSFGGRFKFDDYYSAFDLRRMPVPLTDDIAGETLMDSAQLACPGERLLALQEGLLNVFPKHLR